MNTKEVLDRLADWSRSIGGVVPTVADLEAAIRKDIDAETVQSMVSYGGDYWERGRKQVECDALDLSPDDWSLNDFQDLIEQAMDRVPEDLRASARVELSGGYEESTRLSIKYSRPQTEEEFAFDVGRALMYAREGQAKELRIFERLKAKFGNP